MTGAAPRLLSLVFLAASSLFAQTTVIHAGTVLDGRGGVLTDQYITISESKILTINSGRRTVDVELGKLTLMPGWIDTHVHLDWHFGKDGKLAKQGVDTPEEVVLYDAENAWLSLQGGFTTVQSVGSKADGPVRDRINSGSLPGPHVLTSLRQITKELRQSRCLTRARKADQSRRRRPD